MPWIYNHLLKNVSPWHFQLWKWSENQLFESYKLAHVAISFHIMVFLHKNSFFSEWNNFSEIEKNCVSPWRLYQSDQNAPPWLAISMFSQDFDRQWRGILVRLVQLSRGHTIFFYFRKVISFRKKNYSYAKVP